MEPSAAARTLKGAGLRYGAEDGVPAWAVGKTADEILGLASQMANVLQSSAPAAPAAPAPSSLHVQSYAPAEPQAPARPDPELAYQDPVAYARAYDAYNEWHLRQQLQAVGAPVYQQLADLARTQSQNGAHADVWRRWGPEIELKLHGIPHAQRSLALYDQAAALVKADHVEELARERAETLSAAAGNATERVGRVGAVGGVAQEDPLEKAFASGHPFFEKAKSSGLTPERVRQFLDATGQTPEQYVEAATRGSVLVTQEGFVRTHNG